VVPFHAGQRAGQAAEQFRGKEQQKQQNRFVPDMDAQEHGCF
jgi:hypothetical protein